MVDLVSDVDVLVKNFRRFAFGGEAPKEIEDRLQSIPGVQSDVIGHAAEMLYAYYDQLTEDGKRSCGELFHYAKSQFWTVFNREGRSATIVYNIGLDLNDIEGDEIPPAEWPEPEANRRNNYDWRFENGVKPPAEPLPTPDIG